MPKEKKILAQRSDRSQPSAVQLSEPVFNNEHASTSEKEQGKFGRGQPSKVPEPEPIPNDERTSFPWSEEDDSRLEQYHAIGVNWGPIASQFPNKTPNACRKRHERLMEKKAASQDAVRSEDLREHT